VAESGWVEVEEQNGMNRFVCLPCQDSAELAEMRRRELEIPPPTAAHLGRTALEICRAGEYRTRSGVMVDLRAALGRAVSQVVSIPPGTPLPSRPRPDYPETRVLVCNETTLNATRWLQRRGRRPLALNFASGVQPGGGFLTGARAQEENLCRSSGLFLTLHDNPMYATHLERELADSTDWTILSPEVPVFRSDDGTPLDEPWMMCCATCAAPYAPDVGQPLSGDLLQVRIGRVLAIAQSYGFDSLVLGAWGCGDFGNDPFRTARDFRSALEIDFAGSFAEIVFAIADWSPERRFLGPFRKVFAATVDGPGGH
jgi:uncharacterized protein (TIGR02452 family)